MSGAVRHLALALVLPVATWGALLTWGGQPRPSEEAELETAFLRRQDPEVLVLGSSVARSDVDRHVLATHYGVAPERVAVVLATDAALPVWYLLLRNRVEAAGVRPRVVWVVGTAGQILQASLDTPVDRQAFVRELVGDETAAERAPLDGRRVGALRRAATADQVRQRLVRRLAVGAVALAHGLPLDAADRRYGAARATLHTPGPSELAELDPAATRGFLAQLTRFDRADPPESTLLDTLIRRLRDLGAEIAVVRVPVAQEGVAVDRVPPAAVDALAAFLDARGVAFVDGAAWPLPDDAFEDPLHMRPDAARAFTERAVAALEPGPQ